MAYHDRPVARLFVLVAVLALSGCGMMTPSSSVKLSGKLTGASEVPPVSTSGSGTVEATFNKETNRLQYRVVYTGLTGPATAGHFHGPAAVGQNAGVVLPFKSAASPIEDEAVLTSAQAADLLAGRWYVNVHTNANRGGEIRAQVLPAN